METLASLYNDHLAELQKRAREVLERNKLDALLIHSGELQKVFLDDHSYPFKVNAHFKAWVPVTSVPNCWLWIDGVNKPKLWFYSPVDYWHSVEPLPDSFWTKSLELMPLANADAIAQQLPPQRERVGYIGYAQQRARDLGISSEHINPKAVLNYLDFHRSIKTGYELACMREAQKTAVTGHRAAHEAFLSGMSEFD
ncbi:MAG: Xaa-Pro dipeptidase, partial [Serratia marcescens]|nr:Xaa-Pro dipeptidase [Serratia marcescens]